MKQSIWEFVGERFDASLPRMTAVYVKERDENLSFAYPTGENLSGFDFIFTDKTAYDLPPKFRMEFAAFEYPNISGVPGKNRALFHEQMYYPSLVRRDFEYTNLGIMGTERFGRAVDGALSWSFDMRCRNEWFRFKKRLFSVVRADEAFCVTRDGDVLTLAFGDVTYHIAPEGVFSFGLYGTELDMRGALAEALPDSADQSGYYLLIAHDFDLAPMEDTVFTIGLSAESADLARQGRMAPYPEETARGQWDRWFESLPVVGDMSDREKKVYYKSWWTIKNNYYNHPAWGYSITESLPVYKGIWQWAIPSVEWHSNQNSDYTSQWIKKSMDMMLASQRTDGYITHAIYIDEENPGERWSGSGSGGVIQTPHFPWVAVRYYRTTCDMDSLRRWYAPLLKYYDFICTTRDKVFEHRHLWAITTSFDTGLDTTSAFQRVTYGEEGIPKERYCYAAVFGAERWRYELALAEMADILGLDDGAFYRAEAEKTKEAMYTYLWDDARAWFGVRHEDGNLDTRVGLDGLFALAYGMVDPARAVRMQPNVERLIGPYGVRTVAEGEEGFREDVYWRGASWPKSCSVAMAACQKYYPTLLDTVHESVLKMCLVHPGIWECYNVRNGALAHSDHGFFCTPGMSSNVGAGDIIGALWLYHGLAMYDMDMALPNVPVRGLHWAGMRIDVTPQGARTAVSAHTLEADTGCIYAYSVEGEKCSLQLQSGVTTYM